MKEIIGVKAGEIWLLLGEKGETGIPQLIQLLKEDDSIIYQALGWLAREGKIKSVLKGKTEFVSLTDAECEIYLKTHKEGTMPLKRILAYVSGVIAVISMILAVIARVFFTDKALFGLSALSYLRTTNTMLLFAIAFMVFDYIKKKTRD